MDQEPSSRRGTPDEVSEAGPEARQATQPAPAADGLPAHPPEAEAGRPADPDPAGPDPVPAVAGPLPLDPRPPGEPFRVEVAEPRPDPPGELQQADAWDGTTVYQAAPAEPALLHGGDMEAVRPAAPVSGEAEPVVAPYIAAVPEDEGHPVDTGPNWMLAFVCAWASGTALYYAWRVLGRDDLSPRLHQLALMGYAALGAGLLMFALESLLWGKISRWPAARVLLWLIPLVLTLLGVVCLFQFKDPDPAWGRI